MTWQGVPGLTRNAVDVDLDAPENAAPMQHEDDAGAIQVMRVPLRGLQAALQAQSQGGAVVYAGLWALTAGLNLAS